MKREKIEVVFSITRPTNKLYAGVYIYEPLVDSKGIAWWDITEEINLGDDVDIIVARSIVKIFNHFPELKKIVFYRVFRRNPIELKRENEEKIILKKIRGKNGKF